MMVYASFDAYPLSLRQRDFVRWSMLIIWINLWIATNTGVSPRDFHGLVMYTLNFPPFLRVLTYTAVIAMPVAFIAVVILPIYREHKKLPSANFLIPAIALMIWEIPALSQPEFSIAAVPVLHGLQYNTFVYKLESTRMLREGKRLIGVRGSLYAAALFILSWVLYELIPNSLDFRYDSYGNWNCLFFLSCSFLFLNVTHHFIDTVIWRLHSKENAKVRELLLS
jgi:hypothetical protein